jgi:protein SCO1/2
MSKRSRFFIRLFGKGGKPQVEIRAIQIIVGILVGIALAAYCVLWQTGSDKARVGEMRQEASQESSGQPVPPSGLKPGGPFSLTDQNGKAVTDADYRGKYLLVYFGYTYCPDMCPTGLQGIAHVLDKLGPDAAKVQPLFITIDPARDTPQKLKEYDASFHPQIIGLTGTAAQIAAVAKEYQVYYAKGEQVDDKDYIMDHSSLIYLMDPQGNFLTAINEDADPDTILKALQASMRGQAMPPSAAPQPPAATGTEKPASP